MFGKSVTRIVKEISPYLQDNEKIISMGVFRKIPSTFMMMATRGLAMHFSPMNIIIVTDNRMLVFPIIKESEVKLGEPIESILFEDVNFVDHWFYRTILEIDLPDEELTLRLRFSGKMRSLAMSKQDFIAAMYQRKQ